MLKSSAMSISQSLTHPKHVLFSLGAMFAPWKWQCVLLHLSWGPGHCWGKTFLYCSQKPIPQSRLPLEEGTEPGWAAVAHGREGLEGIPQIGKIIIVEIPQQTLHHSYPPLCMAISRGKHIPIPALQNSRHTAVRMPPRALATGSLFPIQKGSLGYHTHKAATGKTQGPREISYHNDGERQPWNNTPRFVPHQYKWRRLTAKSIWRWISLSQARHKLKEAARYAEGLCVFVF